jgi:hypothetical protein
MLANIQMQKTGSVIASRGVSSLPASDLERSPAQETHRRTIEPFWGNPIPQVKQVAD